MDISMCQDYKCNRRSTCLRYTGVASEPYQTYSLFEPPCSYHIDAADKDTTALDTFYKDKYEQI